MKGDDDVFFLFGWGEWEEGTFARLVGDGEGTEVGENFWIANDWDELFEELIGYVGEFCWLRKPLIWERERERDIIRCLTGHDGERRWQARVFGGLCESL